MAFKLSDEAYDWFNSIQTKSSTGEFENQWEMYYYASMVGIRARERVGEGQEPDTESFARFVTKNFQNQKFEIYSGLVMAEIERQNIPKNEKAEIKSLMLNILDSSDATRLSDDGKTLLNCYAESGYKILRDAGPAPTDFDLFLQLFVQEIEA